MLLAATATNAQTTATNWTAPDCNSVNHTLFTELDSGKVIVFVWVMPCVTCVNPSKTAYNVVQSLAATYPGKVRLYLADDLGDAGCSTLTGWVTANGIGSLSNMTVFSNSGNVIDENNFGGTGMPHIVVMGGPAHQLYYNKKGSASNDSVGIRSAVITAIGATGIESVDTKSRVVLSPNPVTNLCTVSYPTAIKSITVMAPTGRMIDQIKYVGGAMNPSVDMSRFAGGIYMLSITDEDGQTFVQKVVKQ